MPAAAPPTTPSTVAQAAIDQQRPAAIEHPGQDVAAKEVTAERELPGRLGERQGDQRVAANRERQTGR